MNRNRRQVLALFGSTMLSACSAPAIVTRDKNDPFEGGIGGTGIVGTLNGFGSLLINGLKVELKTNTRFRTPFGSGSQDVMAPGQVLTIAARKGSGSITASDISIDYALVGELRRAGATASVNGVPLIGWKSALGHGAAGKRVAVSGVWTSFGVRPSRIDPAQHGQDLIAGTFDEGKIGDATLDAAGPLPNNGTYAVAYGRAKHGSFAVERFYSGRFGADQNLGFLSVDGYLESSQSAPGFRIAGLGHSFAKDLQLEEIGQRRAVYFGPYSGRFDARRGYIVPDEFNARQKILRDEFRQSGTIPFVEV